MAVSAGQPIEMAGRTILLFELIGADPRGIFAFRHTSAGAVFHLVAIGATVVLSYYDLFARVVLIWVSFALASALARLPGLGPRSARRAVLWLIKRRESALPQLLTALDQVRDRGLKVVPQCTFVRAYMQKHPETRDLLA